MYCIACHFKECDFFVRKNNNDIFRCCDCGLLFVYPTILDTAVIYSGDYFHGATGGFGYIDYEIDKEPMIPAFTKYIDLIEKNSLRKGKLLDVGAATGFFIKMAGNRGWEAEGVEISDYAASQARANGHKVKTGSLSSIVTPPETYSVITMFDVFEHFNDPEKELKIAHKSLSKEGLIMINTPNSGSLYAKLLGKNWHLLVPPEHLFLFNQKSLGIMLERVGFKVIMTSNIGKKFTLSYILRMLHKWQGLKIWKKMHEFFSRNKHLNVSLPINFHDNFFVIARKK
ncbi:MAG: class I SAM-dependent methyltransferase [Candidatus Taylorbacteria bacterium]|nr:class I SAM-dependent methyltransferase [Candidatus Taylorbacteria bacterium]